MAVPPLSSEEALRALRTEMRKLRQKIDNAQIWQPATLPPQIVQMILQSAVIGLYAPIGGEPDPTAIGLARGKAAALPALQPDGQMVFRHWAEGEPQVQSPWGGQQPPDSARIVTPDLVLVPLLAFDIRLNRLGQGGGHYDRYFAGYPTVRRIGIAWDAQRVMSLPVRPWDMPLDAVITEQTCYMKEPLDA